MAEFPKSISVGTLISDILTQIGVGNKALIDSSVHPAVGTLAVKQADVEINFELTSTQEGKKTNLSALLPPLFDLFAVTTIGANVATDSFKGFKKDTANIKITIVALGIDPTKTEQLTVNGMIIDRGGNALSYVSVQEKGTSNIQQSDENGKYSIKVKDQNAYLIFSQKGYDTVEQKVLGQSTINIILQATTGPIIIIETGIIVHGMITDKDGNALPNISVQEKGTSNEQQSDKSGKYSITVKDKNAYLVFSQVGYDTVEKQVLDQGTINIILQATTEQIIVNGMIADNDGNALPNISVQEKGTSNVKQSDKGGNYSIQVTDQNAYLIFSQVGYDTVINQVLSQTTMNIKLQATTEQIIVNGMIADNDGNALPNVSVQEKGTSNVQQSDKSGNYSIQVTDKNAYLIFSKAGYDTVANQAIDQTINIKLQATTEQIIVQGMITDKDGNALPNVSVQEKGTSNVQQSDKGGNYSIKVKDKNAYLVFSQKGYDTLEQQVLDQTMNIVLQNVDSKVPKKPPIFKPPIFKAYIPEVLKKLENNPKPEDFKPHLEEFVNNVSDNFQNIKTPGKGIKVNQMKQDLNLIQKSLAANNITKGRDQTIKFIRKWESELKSIKK